MVIHYLIIKIIKKNVLIFYKPEVININEIKAVVDVQKVFQQIFLECQTSMNSINRIRIYLSLEKLISHKTCN